MQDSQPHTRFPSSRSLLAIGAGIVLVLAAVVLASGRVVLNLSGQPLGVEIPPARPVQATIEDAIRVRIPEPVGVRGSIDQTVHIPVKTSLPVTVDFDGVVAMDTTIRYRGLIPLHVTVPVATTMVAHLFGVDWKVPVTGAVPVNMDLPVDLDLPIKQDIPIVLRGAVVTAHVDHGMELPLQVSFDVKVQVNEPVLAVVDGPVNLRATVFEQPIPIILRDALVEVPLRDIEVTVIGPSTP